jgi:hypothetical protein
MATRGCLNEKKVPQLLVTAATRLAVKCKLRIGQTMNGGSAQVSPLGLAQRL